MRPFKFWSYLLVLLLVLAGLWLQAYRTTLYVKNEFGIASWHTEPNIYVGVEVIVPQSLFAHFIKLESVRIHDLSGQYLLTNAWVWPYPQPKNVSVSLDDLLPMPSIAGYRVTEFRNIEGVHYPYNVNLVLELEWTGVQAEGYWAGPIIVSVDYSVLGMKRTAKR